jgi:hypothetical protein
MPTTVLYSMMGRDGMWASTLASCLCCQTIRYCNRSGFHFLGTCLRRQTPPFLSYQFHKAIHPPDLYKPYFRSLPLLKNTREKFRRRKISLFNKADDFHRIFGADVFFVIRKKGRYYTYTSAEKLHWPPTKEQIVSL